MVSRRLLVEGFPTDYVFICSTVAEVIRAAYRNFSSFSFVKAFFIFILNSDETSYRLFDSDYLPETIYRPSSLRNINPGILQTTQTQFWHFYQEYFTMESKNSENDSSICSWGI